MNLFEKVKSLIKGKKPSEEDKSDKDLNKEICEIISSKLSNYLTQPGEPPEGIDKKQWKKILNQITWAWENAAEEWEAKGRFNKKVHRLKILIGFKLFVKYFKFIK